MPNTYKAVLFDLGNVVLKIHFDKTFDSWAQAAGKNPNDIAKIFIQDEAYCAHEIDQITSQQYHQHICKLIGAEITYEQFVAGWVAMLGEAIGETAALLRDLRSRYRLFALTNSNILHRQVWSKNYLDVFSNFERVFCSSEIRARKPEHKAFSKVCEATQVAKEHFVFVDDLDVNIQSAREFGFKSFLFSDPKETTAQIRKELWLG